MKSFPGEYQPKVNEEDLKEEFQKQKVFSNFRFKLFCELTKSLEAKQCAQSIFVQKFERLDMEFLNQTNIYQFHVDKMMK
jgi:hypothetical protein